MKPRLTALAAMAAVTGFILATSGPITLPPLLAVALGAFLIGGGANAVNQYMERDLDALMTRTRLRPLPSGRLIPLQALAFGVAVSVLGALVLSIGANVVAAGVALLTLAIYLGAYTPMKRNSAWNTAIGAVAGALPVLIGWCAAGAALSAKSVSLFLMVVVWQLPHFFAICRLWAEDYRSAGYAMWPLSDATGRRTGAGSAVLCALLIPVSLAPVWLGMAGTTYAAIGGIAGIGFLLCATRMATHPGAPSDRLTFVASIVYLPAVMLALIMDKT